VAKSSETLHRDKRGVFLCGLVLWRGWSGLFKQRGSN